MKNLFLKDKSFYAELFRLTLPIALSSLVTFSLSLVGNLLSARVGTLEASAVFLANQVQMTVQLLNVGIEGAVLVLTAKSDGGDRKETARRYASIGLLCSLIISTLFFAFSFFGNAFTLSLLTDKSELIELGKEYLKIISLSFIPFCLAQSLAAASRAIKKPRAALYASLSALAVTLLFDYLLIPTLGILGIAIASSLGRMLEFIFLFVYVFFIDRELSMKLREIFSFSGGDILNFFKLGSPIILAQAVWCINNFFSSAVIGRLTGDGIVTAAASATALYNLSYVVTNGMSGAVGIITARKLGEEKGEEMYRISRTVQVIFVLLGVLTGLLIQAVKTPFLSLWRLEGETLGFAHGFLAILSVFVIGTAYQSATLGGLIKSSGDTKFILYTESFSVFILIIPITLVLSKLGAHPCLIFAALKCDQIAKCPISFLKLRRMKFDGRHFDSRKKQKE